MAWKVPTLAEWLVEVKGSQQWLLEGIIPAGSLVLLSGQKKRAHKTWFAFSAAVALATGKSLGPWACAGPPTKVLIIEEEGARAGTRDRLLAICRAFDVEPEGLPLLFAFHQGVKLDNKAWRDKLLEFVSEERPALVVLDAIVYMHAGDENKVRDMAPVIETLQAIRTTGATVLFLAHTGTAKALDKKMDVDDQVRGTGLLTDAYDMHIALRRASMKETTIELTVRGRDTEEAQHTIAWDFKQHPSGIVERATLSASQREGLDESPSIPSIVPQYTLLAPCMKHTMHDLTLLWGVSVAEARNLARQFIAEGHIFNSGAFYYRKTI